MATKIITGLLSGMSPEAIRRYYGLSSVEYDTGRRRMRRAMLRHGLTWSDMVVAMTRPGIQSSALVRLLDALEADLLAAAAEELRDVLREAGRHPDGACQEIRAVLGAALQQEDGTQMPTQHNWPTRAALYRH